MEALKTILYYSIFRHPLKIEEIHNFTNHTDISETIKEINYLTEEKILTKIDDFYVYGSDLDSVTKRVKGNSGVKKAMVIAKKGAFHCKISFC